MLIDFTFSGGFFRVIGVGSWNLPLRNKGGSILRTIPKFKSLTPIRLFVNALPPPTASTRVILKNFQQKVSLFLQRGKYTVKTVETPWELKEVLKLRYEVFGKEYQQKKFPFGLDKDAYDIFADHLIILDSEEEKIVGTYRLISSLHSKTFYSQTEFNISNFLQIPGEKLELSRACIHKKYRNGMVMHLLWRGVAEYLKKTNSKYLFGLSSVRGMEASLASSVASYLQEKKQILDSIEVKPLPQFEVESVEDKASEFTPSLVPPLMGTYLKMGARVSPFPARDTEFKCLDFFTVLEVEKIENQFGKKYL